MTEFISVHQQNLMLMLCGACFILIFLLIFTRFLSVSRKAVLILMELTAFLLLWFDRLSYIYAGKTGDMSYYMVRISNFAVFFLTSGIVFCFNMYIIDLLTNEGKLKYIPKGLLIAGTLGAAGMILAVFAAFTGMYYYFDETNVYYRGKWFLVSYISPIFATLIQYFVVRSCRKSFSRLIYISLVMYIFVPIGCGILQIFTYGISVVNMAMVAVSLSLYIFMYLDLNDRVVHMHEIEISNMNGEKKRMKKLFDQTATAFVSAVEKKDEYARGNAIRIAEYARKIAAISGKDEEECEEVYYAALLHDVGLIGIPDSVINNDTDPDKRDYEEMRKKPLIGAEILSSITEYPYLEEGARYCHERYNGTGYPEGLKGEEIPEISRIVKVADAYVSKTSRKRYRDAQPEFMVREAFIKGAGEEFDPRFAEIMVDIMDSQAKEGALDENGRIPEKELVCREYREHLSVGIPIDGSIRRISFNYSPLPDPVNEFSAPSVILFDSYDGIIHQSEREIEKYGYLEYGEIWFDKFSVNTAAKNIEERMTGDKEGTGSPKEDARYEIITGRYKDHLKLILKAPDREKTVTVALPGASRASYIALTGENCSLSDISVEVTKENVKEEDIVRIAPSESYIEHFEADIENIQIDQTRSAATKGTEIENRMVLMFHTMSLPSASLVWNCPYIILYSSADGTVGGSDYREFDVIKLDGENEGDTEYAENRFSMKKTGEFPGWDAWKEANRKGFNCEVLLERKADRITLKTKNLGIEIESTSFLREDYPRVFAALTGDQVALTDIRIV